MEFEINYIVLYCLQFCFIDRVYTIRNEYSIICVIIMEIVRCDFKTSRLFHAFASKISEDMQTRKKGRVKLGRIYPLLLPLRKEKRKKENSNTRRGKFAKTKARKLHDRVDQWKVLNLSRRACEFPREQSLRQVPPGFAGEEGFIVGKLVGADAIYHCWTVVYPFRVRQLRRFRSQFSRAKYHGLIDGDGPITRDKEKRVIKYYFAKRKEKGRRKKNKIKWRASNLEASSVGAFVDVVNHRSSRGIDQFTVSGINRRKKTVAAVYRLITILRELSPAGASSFRSRLRNSWTSFCSNATIINRRWLTTLVRVISRQMEEDCSQTGHGVRWTANSSRGSLSLVILGYVVVGAVVETSVRRFCLKPIRQTPVAFLFFRLLRQRTPSEDLFSDTDTRICEIATKIYVCV